MEKKSQTSSVHGGNFVITKLAGTLSFALGLFLLDRVTKWYFVMHPDEQFDIISDILFLKLHLNTNMALSLPLFPPLYYSLIVIVVIILMVLLVKAMQHKNYFEFAVVTIILSGAFANLVDRAIYGGVVDFISISFWSVFNLADVYIISAIGIWLIKIFLEEKDVKGKTISKT
ncbi:MAG: signal peptidase II [bacterium]|nr:signal peptidase II [bacterium]